MKGDKDAALKLAAPIRIGSMELANRIVKAPTVENMAVNGESTDRVIEFYKRQSQGGAGLIITGGLYVQSNGRTSQFQLGADSDSQIEGLRRLVKTVQGQGTKIVAQVSHSGRQTRPAVVSNDVVGPSAVRDKMTGVLPRAMANDEIIGAIASFGSAARRIQEAGFDGIQVMAGHGYLINQFLSRRTNLRTDRWGGTLEARASLLFRVLERIRTETGREFPMLVKLNTEDHSRRGFTLEESAWVAERLAQHGADALELTGGTYESALNICRGALPAEDILEQYSGWQKLPARFALALMKRRFPFREAYFLDNAKQIKRVVNIPVILVGGLREPQLMERLIRADVVDMVAIGRPLIRQPDLPRRILAGDWRPPACSNCNRCFVKIVQGEPLVCWAENLRQ